MQREANWGAAMDVEGWLRRLGLEPLELRVTKVERLIFAGAGMRGTEGL